MLAGGKNMAEAGLPKGIKFDTGSTHDEYFQYSGGSNAQSSIIQFFDIILGIEHRPTGIKQRHASASGSELSASSDTESSMPVEGAKNSFIHEMRQYMH